VTAALFVLHFFVSIVNTPWLGLLSTIGAWFQILSIVVICITLLAISPKYQSAKFVFTHFVKAPGDGIGSGLLVVLLGLPYAQSILTGFEVGSHVVEEVKTLPVLNSCFFWSSLSASKILTMCLAITL
jgi:amino acid transporter